MAYVRRKIYPPIWLVFGLVAIFCFNEFYPGPRFTGLASQLVGGAIIVAGAVLLVFANGLFTRAGTNVIPFRKATALVTEGVYSKTRNPMYLGMLLVLLGVSITVGSTFSLVVPPVFMVIIQQRFIIDEERMLRETFPEEYPAYCERVRRWI